MMYTFGDSFSIKQTDTVWILSAGPSLDFFDLKLIKPEHIVITVNSALSYYQTPDFCIGSDGAAVLYYKKYWKSPTLWLTQQKHAITLEKAGIPCCDIGRLVNRQFKGSGLDSLWLAWYFSHYQKAIKNIYYAGLDFSEIVNGKDRYYYASKLDVLDWQRPNQLPAGWYKSARFQVTKSSFNSYVAQLNWINRYILTIPGFRQKLKSMSYIDLAKYNQPILSNNRFGTPHIM